MIGLTVVDLRARAVELVDRGYPLEEVEAHLDELRADALEAARERSEARDRCSFIQEQNDEGVDR